MLIWVLAALLVGGFGLIGHQSGVIRWGLAFIGVAIGLGLTGVLGGPIGAGLAAMGVKDQIALDMLPGVITFLIFTLIFLGVGIALHRPVDHHFKYRSDEPTRQAFERTNQALGLFVGLLSGICVYFSVGKYIYHNGYLAVQTTSESAEATPVRYVAQLRQEMESTGWAKTFAAVDSTTTKYYDVADILGILHANPLVHGRAESYPPFLTLAEAPEFTDIGADAEYMKLLQEQPSLAAVLNNPKTQTILNSATVMEAFQKTDLKDFRQYLETGESPRYESEKILGHWRADPGAIFTTLKRQRLNLSPVEVRKIRETLTPILAGTTLTAYTDGRFTLKIAAVAPVETPAPDAAQTEAQTEVANSRSAYLARYGITGQAAAPAQAAPKAAPTVSAPTAIPVIDAFEGTWVRTDGTYVLSGEMKGQKLTLEALVNETGRLTWTFGSGDKKLTVFFVRTS
jgi:hypothetical protein